MAGSTRLDQLFRKLAGKLNSNEAFHPDQGFQLDLTLVHPMGQGSGNDRQLNPGRMGYTMSRLVKNSIMKALYRAIRTQTVLTTRPLDLLRVITPTDYWLTPTNKSPN